MWLTGNGSDHAARCHPGRNAVEARLGDCPPLERVWILSLLDRHEGALDEGLKLLENAQEAGRFPTIVATD